MMNKTLTALLMGSVLLCAGCDGSSQKLNDVIGQAQRTPDAWQGLQQLQKEADALDVRTFSNLFQDPVTEGKTYQDAYFGLFKKALAQGRTPALVSLFSRPNLSDLKQQYVGVLVSQAEHAAGDKQDAALLSTAGDLFAQGNWAVTDSARAAGYYARAWLAGDKKAPRDLYNLFAAQRDYPSAYLWGIRCIGDCYYGTNQALTTDVRSNLTPAQIVMVQRLAKDRRVITVNELGAKDK